MHEIEFRPEDLPLKEDVGTLGRLLGEVLEALEGKALFAHVELARQTARARRQGEADAEQRFRRLLKGLSCREAVAVARAFSSYFGLVNLAERAHRIRRRRARERAGDPVPGSYAGVLGILKAAGLDGAAIQSALDTTQFKPVFTAHPTEAVRRTLLTKEQRIAQILIARLNTEASTALDDVESLHSIQEEIALAWQTDEHFDQPSVADETEHLLFYLTNVVYPTLPEVHESLRSAIEQVFPEDKSLRVPPSLVRFGSWVGGDMDGNPNVGPDTIRATLERQRELVIELYRRDVRGLFDHLSHSRTRISVSEDLNAKQADYCRELRQVYAAIPARYRDMPYRVFLWFCWWRLGETLADRQAGYAHPGEFLSDLRIVESSLKRHGGTGVGRICKLIRRVETFGFHLAALDIRENSAVHRAAVAEALSSDSFERAPPSARAARLREALAGPMSRPGFKLRAEGPLTRCLNVMGAIAECRRRFGCECIGLYIISMARGADDALAVLYLARLAGFATESEEVPLDVAPLFETVEDLAEAPATLDALLADEGYRAHLRARDMRQFVMLGYSDSNKAAGLGASRWALHEAQISLVEIARRTQPASFELTMFHGRGGTISRGGGEPRNGILAEPPGALGGMLRVTEQGEIIGQKYGIPATALETIEVAVGALLERRVLDNLEPPDDSEWHEVAVHFAHHSRDAYQGRLLGNRDLIPYFRAATPIDVIERLRIGSRPASRRQSEGIDGLRAIPWVFAWTQSRHSLTGWFGVGAGLEAAADRYGLETLRQMSAGWRFFETLISDTEMVLAKADMGIAAQYAELAGEVGERFYPCILEEFERTCAWICQVRDQNDILDRNPVLQRAIRLRNPYVDPLSLIQLDFLKRWRKGHREDAELERVLVETVRGLARGMQNTG